MEGPAFVLIPPTPTKYTDNTSPSLASTPSTRPDSRSSRIEEERTSSETTIFTIYSMYEDGQANRASWPTSRPDMNVTKSKDNITTTLEPPPQINLPLTDNYRNSVLKSNGFAANDLAHALSQPTRTIDLAKVAAMAALPMSNDVNYTARASDGVNPRPASSYITAMRTEALFQDRRASTGQTIRTSNMTTSSSDRGDLFSSHSRESSNSRDSQYSAKRIPRHYTNSLHHKPAVSRALDTPPVPPKSPTPPRGSSLGHPSPRTPPIPLKPPISINLSSPASNASLVPSEGEDIDAFHVRNTYAQLEISGVKGDGYEEGVERTRARVGVSRMSQINAAEAVGNGNERRKELEPQEQQLLASLDRYGFFSVPSHDRLVRLPLQPLTKRLSSVPAGPSSAPSQPKILPSLPSPPHPIREFSRIAKWTRMLAPGLRDTGGNIEAWSVKPTKEHKLRERTYKGIPDCWRAAVWELLMTKFTGMRQSELDSLVREYREALEKPSSYDIQIDLDVPRTISGHVMFRTRYGAGQRSLFHVLHSFSLHCSTCGYVQGMGPIAATLLCYFDPSRVYTSLIRLHDSYSMHTVFSPGFPGLLEAIYVQERITEQMMPGVYAAFKRHMVSTTSYATKWYITLFANSVPFQTLLRLWDAFLLEGQDVFVAAGVAIVWVYRDHITASSANFETILSLLSSFFVPEDENVLLSWVEKMLSDKKTRSNMRVWREEWNRLAASGQDGTALL